ncbi:O-antigen ligase family protein [Candidatus Parabeggiatoa sp. HSG14]|uniref:O-antigen ligase family protein n=1 Tax=Candidatus Parabeggiatoa sp. HSG14 TaxID=3055593 RepID=UPI0025A6EDB2|nr:O-antigen ligase family protein [Thiotrichales bacterium HSG14]
MLTTVVLIPAFIAAYFAFTHSPHKAFLNVYVPTLLLFPPYYQWKPPFIPDPNFYEAAVIPIILAFLVRGMPGWKFTLTDVFVLGFTFFISTSEYINYGYKDAQNLMARMLLSVICPYVLAKSLIEPAGLRIEFAKRIVLVLFIISFFLVYENHFRTGYTVWQSALGRFFDFGWARAVRFRWGMARANGPFIHPIQAGIIMVIGFQLHQWLVWNRAWPSQLKNFSLPFFTVPQIMTIVLLFGVFAPLSRAPWLGLILIGGVIFVLSIIVSFSKKPLVRYLIILAMIGGIVIGAMGMNEAFNQFASVGREEAGETSQERRTIAYRFELYITYGEIVLDRWVWGWGRMGWPKDTVQPSVDNAYLFLALNHGLIAVGCLLALFFFIMLKLFAHIMSQPAMTPAKSALAITLLSLFVHEFFCLATVSLNTTNLTLLFIIIGWSDGYLHNRKEHKSQVSVTDNQNSKLPFKFRRFM